VPWLVSESRVLASVEIAEDHNSRRRGLRGRDHLQGAFILRPCSWVHTIGMRFAIDVAHIDAEGTVMKITQMPPFRIGVPVRRARFVVEAEHGAFERWGLNLGDPVELRTDDE
jgi:uncharacterized membrane protein (UPF0127 family)